MSNAILFSLEPKYTYTCLLKMKLKENLLLIIGSIALLTFAYMQIRNLVLWCKYGKIAKGLYKDVIDDLKNVSQRTSGLSQSEILHKF